MVTKPQAEYYTIKEVAQKTDLSERYLKELIRAGKLEGVKAFTKWFVGSDDLKKFILENGQHSSELINK